MVNYAYVQNRVYYGYGKCAIKIGQTWSVYRAPNGINPISVDNYIQDVYMSYNVSWNYMKANKYGNNVWQLIVDGSLVQLADYLVGNGKTFFISAYEPIMPINGVECDRIVTLTRPNGPSLPGANPYGGYDPTNVLTILEAAPVSILIEGKATSNPFKLPLETKSPRFQILIPNLPNVEPRIGDLMDDDRGVRYGIETVEESEFGFRCSATSVQV